MRRIDVAVIGAGQAGLATSFELARRGIEHVVLDRGRVAESWRTRRWDSFTLVAPNWSFDLPGRPYNGPDRDGFMLRDELVSRFQSYADEIRAPVETGVDVTAVRPGAGGDYRLETSRGEITARAVVAATGAYQRHRRPPSRFDPSIRQIHTDEFRNAGELEDGGVLVIGSGQSGCQIAEDLARHGRRVWLATGSCGWIPRRHRGKDNVDWRMAMGMFDDPVSKLGHAMRLACPPIQTGVDGGRDLNLHTLGAAGVRLTGRYLGSDGTRVTLADDLPSNVTGSDEVAARFRATIDDFVRRRGLEAPDEPPAEPLAPIPDAPLELDLMREDIRTVIWGTGFRLDFSWIALDLNDRDGYPEQTQGVSPHRGLYFMGLQLMHTRKSGLIFGVGEDAAHVAAVIAERLGAPA